MIECCPALGERLFQQWDVRGPVTQRGVIAASADHVHIELARMTLEQFDQTVAARRTAQPENQRGALSELAPRLRLLG